MKPAQSVKISPKLATALYEYLEEAPFDSFGQLVRYACVRFLTEVKE